MKKSEVLASSDVEIFFGKGGKSTFILTPTAAIEACRQAASKKFLIIGIEGGVIEGGKFMIFLDSIWSGQYDLNLDKIEEIEINNLRALEDIEIEKQRCNAFVLTTKKL